MKANSRCAFALALPLALTLLASCSEQRVIPVPAPSPTPAPSPSPRPVQPLPPPAMDWREAPVTPGDWTWSMADGQSVASFAGGLVQLRCDRAAGTVTLSRRGQAAGRVPMTVLSSDATRPLTGTAVAGPAPAVTVALPARDPLLDAMAFSRGHFALEVSGMATLYVPSWPEVSRVIEDCR